MALRKSAATFRSQAKQVRIPLCFSGTISCGTHWGAALVNAFMQRAIDLAIENVRSGRGGPFAAVVVQNGQVVASGANCVTSTNDPTAHAEITAIRQACHALSVYQLAGCDIYTSCEPCPMCLGAIYWARPDRVFFSATAADATAAGFDDSFIYDQFKLPYAERSIPIARMTQETSLLPFEEWAKKTDRIEY